ncbi:Bug family tripartite tricarboxylate transporter substrate binding protein [Zwartia vadi]|uniref:Bug family tripartite tricarboxylate transporter substrate binding protein n=1 Tax=Zwartia vadi TaxID=3058168 RepID=UPI0025B32EA4|nr:tripartite tricarboxylate transporter substrate binding protein [Zwartia vadi]MDN3987981.1 tripartite tricarboxylate transporter substrate binding protein [Zwartia vadi]
MKLAMLIAFASVALITTGPSSAQDYPNRPIRMVTPIASGGMTDVVSRVIGAKLAERLGQPVVIENRPGGGGNIGAEAVVRSAPDGYTLLFAYPGPIVVSPSLTKSLSYDPERDLKAVSLLGTYPMVLAVNSSLPVKTVGELVEYARSKPGQLSYGSAGNASTSHLAMELLRRQAGIEMTHIPYKGAAPAMTDLMAGRIQLVFDSVQLVMPQHQAGKLRALAVSSRDRSPTVDLPGMAEAGLQNVDVSGWFGIFVPAGTPQPIVDRLSRELASIVRDPALVKDLLGRGIAAVGSSPQELATRVKDERQMWGKVIQDAGIRAD